MAFPGRKAPVCNPLSTHSIDPCNHITDTVDSNSNSSRGDGVEPIFRVPNLRIERCSIPSIMHYGFGMADPCACGSWYLLWPLEVVGDKEPES